MTVEDSKCDNADRVGEGSSTGRVPVTESSRISISIDDDNDNNNNTSIFNPNDITKIKVIPCHLFHPENRITREEAIDFNYHCKLGLKIGSKQNDTNEERLKEIIARVRAMFEGELKAMVIDVIKKECFARNIKWQGNPITKIDHLAKAWADDDTLQEGLWHCCFGAFAKEVDWESEYEQQAMEKLKFEYLEDEQAQREGSNQRGNKGCIAKLAKKVKRDIMKTINRKAAKTHGTILVSGCAPEIVGEYDNGKTKYKKRKGNSDFNFNELMHTKVCYKCFVIFVLSYTLQHNG